MPTRLVALALCAVGASAIGLLDDTIGASSVMYLDSAYRHNWTATDGTTTVPATVPGDLVTDLQRAGAIGDPLFGTNWKGATPLWDAGRNWSVSTTFDYAIPNGQQVFLVLDSIKMGAVIVLNGQVLQTTTDQFLRYVIPVTTAVRSTGNVLTVILLPSKHVANKEGRFMGCSGGWDWAPYSDTYTNEGDHTQSKGIAKSVYLINVQSAAITHVVPQIRYTGAYPTAPLTDATAAPFNVTVAVHMLSPQGSTGTLTITGSWGTRTPIRIPVTLPASSDDTLVNVPLGLTSPGAVSLWWPLGLGSQTLYTVEASWTPSTGGGSVASSRSLGFRSIYLVTANDTDPSTLAGRTGSDSFTMRLKVNGADMYARGANMIPMDEFEGRQSAEAYSQLMISATDAHFNTLRVWGGGLFLPNAFYDTADRLGVLIYHDLMFGQPWNGGTGGTPVNSPTQTAEIQHAVRRLAHHPSIALWSGGNEWQGNLGIFTSFVIPTLVREDSSRPVWPISPAHGWSTGVDMLTGLPNGQPFAARTSGREIETHGPYQHGEGFATVNSGAAIQLFNANTPPRLQRDGGYGPGQQGTFASEFGGSVFSSAESMGPTLATADWSPHAAPMKERNYACDNFIQVYFGPQTWTPAGSLDVLRKATYLCMIGQALEMKADIEVRRGHNSWGTLTWQLNEIWPTGGWGSLEYGTVGFTSGQVIGGRWKPLHHIMADHVYRDVLLVCGADASCYAKNDNPIAPFTGNFTVTVLNVGTGAESTVASGQLNLPRGGGAITWLCADGGASPCHSYASFLPSYGGCVASGANCLLLTTVVDASTGAVVDSDTTLVALPSAMTLPAAHVTFSVGSVAPDGSVPVTVTSDAVALFVTLTTLAQGRFSTNAFTLRPTSPAIVHFIPFGLLDSALLASSIRVEHVRSYI